MSSVINNSNANSAIVQTLDASVSKRNPQIYSTKEIYPAHSMTYVKNEKTNGSVTSGNSINFNLNKYGIASQILLHLEKNILTDATPPVGDGTGRLAAGDIFTIIKSIELLSSSRVISTLTSTDLMAQFSDMTQDEYNVVFQKAINIGTGAQALNPGKYVFVLPLVFGLFKDINTQPNLSFVEPMSLRVNFGIVDNHTTAAANSTCALNDLNCYLQVRYKAYPEASVAEVIDQNYSEPELNQLSTRFYDENSISKTIDASAAEVAAATAEVSIDLKNTDAVTDFYVVIRPKAVSGKDANAKNGPFSINSVKFTGSGQDILDLTQDELAYARLTDNGNAVFPLETETSTFGITDIVKVQTGLLNKYAMSNCFSLREINAPRITVNYNTPLVASGNTLTYEVSVVEDCLAIYSTSSATGRQVLSLTN